MAKIPKGFLPVEGSERHEAPGARLVGPADPREVVSVTIRIRPRPDSPELPSQEQWGTTPETSPKPLSREELSARYGASLEDLAQVTDFARKNGLVVVRTSADERSVFVSGTVSQMNRAFVVKLGRYKSPGQSYRGRVGFIYVPEELADVIQGVFGLDNRQAARHFLARSSPPPALLPPQPLSPLRVAELYDFPRPTNATGQTIGILEFGGGYAPADIRAFLSGLGGSFLVPALTDVGVDGAANAPIGTAANPSDLDTEVTLDIDVASAIAQGANIVVYFAPNTEQGWVDAVTAAVHDTVNAPSVISICWGGPENEWTLAAISNITQELSMAARAGITVLAASGDSGSAKEPPFDGKAHVMYPAADPWVTACGGTLIQDVTGATCTESTWNDGGDGATGGGVSDDVGGQGIGNPISLPPWQQGVRVPPSANDGTTIGRGVPDVAGNASPLSGYALVVYGQQTQPVGGTGAAVSLYAGLVALINSITGKRAGYLNPMLYSLAGTNLFRDIKDGANNGWSLAAGTNTPSYTSGPGWDACTGLGSIDGTVLLATLGGPLTGQGKLLWSVKYVSGFLSPASSVLQWTDINIHNPTNDQITFSIKIVGESPGFILKPFGPKQETLGANDFVSITSRDIWIALGMPSLTASTGFVEITCDVCLSVVAVYDKYADVREKVQGFDDIFPESVITATVAIKGVGKDTVKLMGPTTVRRGQPRKAAAGQRISIPIEIVSMNAEGTTSIAGGQKISICLNPERRSVGEIVPLKSGGYESFIDVSFEAKIPKLGMTLVNLKPARVMASLGSVPPSEDDKPYAHKLKDKWQTIELYDKTRAVIVGTLTQVTHTVGKIQTKVSHKISSIEYGDLATSFTHLVDATSASIHVVYVEPIACQPPQ